MTSINKGNGVDIILDILRQAQFIRTKEQNKEMGNSMSNNVNTDSKSYNPRVSLRSPDTDKELLMSRKGHNQNQRRKDESFHKIKNEIENIINRMTAQDYKRISDEGFKVEDLTIESLAFAVKLVKDYGDGYGSNIKKASEKKKEEAKDRGTISDNEIKKRMEDKNLPINKESIERIKSALTLSEGIPHMSKKDILNLLRKELSPSIENLYKTRFSSKNSDPLEKLSETGWNELIPQVKDIISKAGITDDNDVLESSKWLIENNIPLTENNINLMVGLDDLINNYDKDIIFDKILSGMKEGVLPGDVILIGKDKLHMDNATQSYDTTYTEGTNINQLIEDIHGITEGEVIRAVHGNQDITIRNLIDIRDEYITYEDLPKHESEDELSMDKLSKDKLSRVLTAKRQLEEIRLKMTLEAAQRLKIKGFNIETEALEEVVDKLRYEEEIYYKELYNQASIEANEESLRLLQTTTDSINELKTMPAHVLGRTLDNIRFQTVAGLLDEGRSILTELDKAKDAYETLITKPKSEYGDSIKKAFGNISSLMKEMGIENTEYNQRAIRILGYNQMDITKESIERVKAYDFRVNYLIQNLNPEIAIQIIKEGINPLDTSLDDLNNRIETLKEQGFSSLDKYSAYLHKMEKEEGISEAERKAYIGIYRLLYQIEKSDGAALGAVIKSDQEVTLNHLLIALRTSRKGGMDYKVDDKFGILQEISSPRESITDQLKAVFSNDVSHDDTINGANTYSSEQLVQEGVQKAIVKELLEGLSPWRLSQLHQSIQNIGLNSKGEPSNHENAWDTIGNIPIEQLLDQVKNIQANPGVEQDYYYERLRELREVYNNSHQAIRFLNDFKLPCTTTNLMMAGHILNNSGTVFKKLFGIYSDKEDETFQNDLKKKLDLSDTLIDNKTMNAVYEQLEQEVKAVIDEEAVKDHIDLNSLTQLKSMGMQMHFIKNMAKREFYQIPIETSGRVTNINLTIIRGKLSEGKVTVTLQSDLLGSIRAEAALKDNKLSGYISCNHIEGLRALKEQTEPLNVVLEEEAIDMKQLNFCLQQPTESLYTYNNSWDPEKDKSPETERTLYRIAKAMIQMIRSAEEVDSVVA